MTEDEIAAIEARHDALLDPRDRASYAIDDIPALVAEIKRLSEQLRIATDALELIATGGINCDSPWVVADDALTQMSVVE